MVRPRRRNREDTQISLPSKFHVAAQPFLCLGCVGKLGRMEHVPGRARLIGSEHVQVRDELSQGFKANPPINQTAYAKT
jgi:hypothetical protein